MSELADFSMNIFQSQEPESNTGYDCGVHQERDDEHDLEAALAYTSALAGVERSANGKTRCVPCYSVAQVHVCFLFPIMSVPFGQTLEQVAQGVSKDDLRP